MAHGLNAAVAVSRIFDGKVRTLRRTTDYWGWVEGLYLAKNDDGVALRLYHGYDYEPQSRKLWKRLCADAELVIDVGAHTGIYSLDAWRAGAKLVLSVEPCHLNYARLLMNLRHANFSSEASVFCALGDVDDYALLTMRGVNHYCSSGCTIGGKPTKGETNSAQYPVYVRRLDTLLAPDMMGKIAVIKIDTERNGVRVLRGAPHTLEHRPDLILECIEEGMDEILRPLGYRFYRINEDRDENYGLTPVPDLSPDTEFTFHSPNRFASVKEW